jgi:hypothetical protein
MSESEILEQLAAFTDTVLTGVTVFFSVISAYVAALNYFISRTSILGRLSGFLFLTFVLALLAAVMLGAQTTHAGLIASLEALGPEQLSPAGRAALGNASLDMLYLPGLHVSIDTCVRVGLWGGLALTYFGLFLLTFVFRWGDEA